MSDLKDWADTLPWRELDRDTAMMVTGGAAAGEFSDRSKAALSLALRFLNHGRTFREYVEAMTDPTNRISEWFYDLRDGHTGDRATGRPRKSSRGHQAALRELERCWEKAYRRELPKQWTKRDRIRSVLMTDRHRVAGVLPTRRRHTRLAVYDSLVSLAIVHASYTITASKYQLAEAAGCSHPTVWSALADLIDDAGAVRRDTARGRRPSEAASYTLTPDTEWPKLDHSTSLYTRCVVRSGPVMAATAANLPIWRHRDLGQNGRHAHSALDHDDPLTLPEWSALSGVCARTLRRKAKLLESRGLAVRNPDGWLRGQADPAEVASEDAVIAARVAKIRHRNLRLGWQNRLSENSLPRSGVLAQPVTPQDYELPVSRWTRPVVP